MQKILRFHSIVCSQAVQNNFNKKSYFLSDLCRNTHLCQLTVAVWKVSLGFVRIIRIGWVIRCSVSMAVDLADLIKFKFFQNFRIAFEFTMCTNFKSLSSLMSSDKTKVSATRSIAIKVRTIVLTTILTSSLCFNQFQRTRFTGVLLNTAFCFIVNRLPLFNPNSFSNLVMQSCCQ